MDLQYNDSDGNRVNSTDQNYNRHYLQNNGWKKVDRNTSEQGFQHKGECFCVSPQTGFVKDRGRKYRRFYKYRNRKYYRKKRGYRNDRKDYNSYNSYKYNRERKNVTMYVENNTSYDKVHPVQEDREVGRTKSAFIGVTEKYERENVEIKNNGNGFTIQ